MDVPYDSTCIGAAALSDGPNPHNPQNRTVNAILLSTWKFLSSLCPPPSCSRDQVPSMFEPCGLTQLIAIRYGALPLVRRTGGLADTVHDVDQAGENGNGFVFEGGDEGAMNGALDRAIQYYKEKPQWWSEHSIKNMESECGWRDSAKDYVQLYDSISC